MDKVYMYYLGDGGRYYTQDELSRIFSGQVIDRIEASDQSRIVVHFQDGLYLDVCADNGYGYGGQLELDYDRPTKTE